MLVVLAGRPGTGKTTLSRRLAAELHAAVMRVDAVEAVVVRYGLAEHPVGAVGYGILHELAAGCLTVGTSVVVDAVNPVPQARTPWQDLARACDARLLVVEVTLSDVVEHERRVRARESDVVGLVVPTWEQVRDGDYAPWDEDRDGPRLVVDTVGGVEPALAAVLAALAGPGPRSKPRPAPDLSR